MLRPQSHTKAREFGLTHLPTHVARNHASIKAIIRDVTPQIVIHTACKYEKNNTTVADLIDSNICLGASILESLSGVDTERNALFINAGTGLPSATSLYALSKFQFSEIGRFFSSTTGNRPRFVDLHIQTIYGFEVKPTRFTSHFLHACCSGAKTFNLTSGTQHRDFVHIHDVLRAFESIVRNHHSMPSFETIPVGSGTACSVRDFATTAKTISSSNMNLRFGALPDRPNEAHYCVADTTKLMTLGWQRTYTLENGLLDVIKQIQSL